ncbi:MAG TPA: HEAT repeat domain-containing protein [Polyangia bacterium]
MPPFVHAPFRPLRPYLEADQALYCGREEELEALAARLAAGAAAVLLHGAPGSGKTSLVRAGLGPRLAAQGVPCQCVDAGELTRAAAAPPPAPDCRVLIVDDVGAALDGAAGLERLRRLLQTRRGAGGPQLLLVADDADVWRLAQLEGLPGDPAAPAARLRLEPLDEARVARIIERTVLGGGGHFDAELPPRVAADLTRDGPVLPALLQLVAGEATALRITRVDAYLRAGGAAQLTWRYFEHGCDAAGGRRALHVLGAVAHAEPRAVVPLDALGREAGLAAEPAGAIASTLAGAGLLREVATAPGPGYALGTEWVRPLARTYTGAARSRGVAGRLALRRARAGRRLLGPWQLLQVRRDAGLLDDAERAVTRRSLTLLVAAAAAVVLVPALIGGGLHLRAGRARHFDVLGPGPAAPVVVRRGPPGSRPGWLPHRPPLGAALTDSGFERAAFTGGPPAGVWRADDDWMRRLRGGLRPLPAALAAFALGDPRPLAACYGDPALRPAVLDVIAAAGQGTPEELALVARALNEGPADLQVRAVRAAARLERRLPGQGLDLLAAAAAGSAPAVRTAALGELSSLGAESATTVLGGALARAADDEARRALLDALEAHLPRAPAAAAQLARALPGAGRAPATAILERVLGGTDAAAQAAEGALLALALDATAPEAARLEALRLLRGRTAAFTGLEALTDPPRLAAAALPLLARARPEDAAAKARAAAKGRPEQRAGAAAALGVLPKAPDTAKLLKTLTRDPSAEVRAEAVRALPVLGREAAAQLAREAKTGGPLVERAAVETLGANAGKLGVTGAAWLLELAARRGRPSTRLAAVAALGRLAEARADTAAAVLARLARDKAVEVRAATVAALGNVLGRGAREALGPLGGLARDADAGVRLRAVRALGRARGALAAGAAKTLCAHAADADPAVRGEVATLLGTLAARGPEVTAALATLAGDANGEVRAGARGALRRVGGSDDAVARSLAAWLRRGAAAERSDVAATAGAVGAWGVVGAALADPELAVRRAAAESARAAAEASRGPAAGAAPGATAAAALATALADPDPAVRTAAARGLAAAQAGGALAQAARDADPHVRAAALAAWAESAGAAARPALEAALGDPSEHVRAAAVRGLGSRGADGVALLRRAQRDPAGDVRAAAVTALGGALGDTPPAALAPLLHDEADADLRLAAALALARQAGGPGGAAARRELEQAAQRGGPAVSLAARVALAFAGHADEMATFVRLLRAGG